MKIDLNTIKNNLKIFKECKANIANRKTAAYKKVLKEKLESLLSAKDDLLELYNILNDAYENTDHDETLSKYFYAEKEIDLKLPRFFKMDENVLLSLFGDDNRFLFNILDGTFGAFYTADFYPIDKFISLHDSDSIKYNLDFIRPIARLSESIPTLFKKAMKDSEKLKKLYPAY